MLIARFIEACTSDQNNRALDKTKGSSATQLKYVHSNPHNTPNTYITHTPQYTHTHCTYVDESRVVATGQIVQNAGLVQKRQLSHVLHFVELWRVHLLCFIFVHLCLLPIYRDCQLLAALPYNAALNKALFWVRDPYQLLLGPVRMSNGVVDLPTLHLQIL